MTVNNKRNIKKRIFLVYTLFFGVGLLSGVFAFYLNMPLVFVIGHVIGMAASWWVAASIECPNCGTNVFKHKALLGKFIVCPWPVTHCACCNTQYDLSYYSFWKWVVYILLFLLLLSLLSQTLGLVLGG